MQLSLFPAPPRPPGPCPRCGDTGTIYHIPGRGVVIGGKRLPCPACAAIDESHPQ